MKYVSLVVSVIAILSFLVLMMTNINSIEERFITSDKTYSNEVLSTTASYDYSFIDDNYFYISINSTTVRKYSLKDFSYVDYTVPANSIGYFYKLGGKTYFIHYSTSNVYDMTDGTLIKTLEVNNLEKGTVFNNKLYIPKNRSIYIYDDKLMDAGSMIEFIDTGVINTTYLIHDEKIYFWSSNANYQLFTLDKLGTVNVIIKNEVNHSNFLKYNDEELIFQYGTIAPYYKIYNVVDGTYRQNPNFTSSGVISISPTNHGWSYEHIYITNQGYINTITDEYTANPTATPRIQYFDEWYKMERNSTTNEVKLFKSGEIKSYNNIGLIIGLISLSSLAMVSMIIFAVYKETKQS